MEDRLLTLADVAERLQISIGTLYDWRTIGRGPRGIKVGAQVRVRESELERWLTENQDRRTA